MTERAQVTALQCATMVILAMVGPTWLIAIPVTIVSLAIGAAIVRRPALVRHGVQVLGALLTPPSANHDNGPSCRHPIEPEQDQAEPGPA